MRLLQKPQVHTVKAMIKPTNKGTFTKKGLQTDILRSLCDRLTLAQSLPHWLRALSRQNQLETPYKMQKTSVSGRLIDLNMFHRGINRVGFNKK